CMPAFRQTGSNAARADGPHFRAHGDPGRDGPRRGLVWALRPAGERGQCFLWVRAWRRWASAPAGGLGRLEPARAEDGGGLRGAGWDTITGRYGALVEAL